MKSLEVRAEGSRRGFSELGNEMKLTKRSLILLGARAMLLCKTEPRATAKAASRAKSHPARQRSGCRACTRLLDATLLKEIGGDAMMHPPKGGRAAPSLSAVPTSMPSALQWGCGPMHRESACAETEGADPRTACMTS